MINKIYLAILKHTEVWNLMQLHMQTIPFILYHSPFTNQVESYAGNA